MNRILKLIITLGIFLTMTSMTTEYLGITIISDAATEYSHPNMYININEIDLIKEKVRSNQEPWKVAYDDMISRANSVLNMSTQSVVYGGEIPSGGDKHDYWTDRPYSSDGIYDPNADREDYYAAMDAGYSIRNLGLAYAFTGESKYADKAIKLIRGWTIDPSTKMNPKYTNYQSRIELSVTMPAMFYGADLIWNYPGFTYEDKSVFKSWTAQMINSAKTWSTESNYDLWRLVLISSGSVITDDSSNMQYAFDTWKNNIPIHIDSEGKMVQELHRTRSLFYSLYGIGALIQTAEIARHQGVDLYNYKSSGRGIELALDFHAPYAAGKKSWPYQEIRWDLIDYSLYELAYSFKNKDSYKDVITKRGRPMYEKRIMGPVTLTHADANFIIGPGPTPGPTVSPSPTVSPVPTLTPGSAISIFCYKKTSSGGPTPVPTPITPVPTSMPTPVPSQTPVPTNGDKVPSGYNLFWSDNFDDQIDINKWIIWDTDDGYWYPNNVKTENGNLKLIGEKDSDNRLHTGSIRSKDTFQYGYISIKAKLTKGKGFMSQLWMNSITPKSCDPNPPHWTGTYPEIDLNEMPGDYVDTVSNTIHWWTSGCDGGIKQKVTRPDTDLTQDFHYYGVEWDKDNIKFYFDGQPVYTVPNEIYEPMNIILGLCIARNDGECGGSNSFDSSTPFPGTMYVDFVRVYKK